MGMGDRPVPFTPEHRRIRDDVIGREFADCSVRSCPHPRVIAKYGVGGVANVSVYTCRRCKFHTEDKLCFGVNCGYME